MKTAEELTEALKKSLGNNLKSVILYGSAAAQDQSQRYSDINVLIVVDQLGLSDLKATMPVTKKWANAGNPPPLFFTESRVRQAADVFPIEFFDIKASRRVLWGEDVFSDLTVHTTHLRHEIEYELRGKLIQLRERYLETQGKPKAVRELLARAISTFTILFRAVLRLLGEEPPKRRADVLSALHQHVKMDLGTLSLLLGLRENNKEALDANPEDLLAALLTSVEDVIDFVDQYEHRP